MVKKQLHQKYLIVLLAILSVFAAGCGKGDKLIQQKFRLSVPADGLEIYSKPEAWDNGSVYTVNGDFAGHYENRNFKILAVRKNVPLIGTDYYQAEFPVQQNGSGMVTKTRKLWISSKKVELAGKEKPDGNTNGNPNDNSVTEKSTKQDAVPQLSQNSNSSFPAITDDSITRATQTSALKDGNVTYSAQQSIDGDVKTCWAEGVPGYGIKEGISFEFNNTYKITGCNIWTGYQKSEDLFYKNSRPVALQVRGEDGYDEIHRLNDSMGMQRITFKRSVNTRRIQLSVAEVAKGSKYEDTCISEISFF